MVLENRSFLPKIFPRKVSCDHSIHFREETDLCQGNAIELMTWTVQQTEEDLQETLGAY